MSSRQKYRPDIALEDIAAYVQEHAQETGYAAQVVLDFPPTLRAEARATVQLRPVRDGLSGTPLVQASGPVPLRAQARQMSAILHIVAQAYQELEVNPWLWSPERRKIARGDTP